MSIRLRVALLALVAIVGAVISLSLVYSDMSREVLALNAQASRNAWAQESSQLVHMLQRERGSSSGFLVKRQADQAERMQVNRRNTDLTLSALLVSRHASPDRLSKAKLDSLADKIRRTRELVDSGEINWYATRDVYTQAIAEILDSIVYELRTDDNRYAGNLAAIIELAAAREALGLSRATMYFISSQRAPSPRDFVDLATYFGIYQQYLHAFERDTGDHLSSLVKQYPGGSNYTWVMATIPSAMISDLVLAPVDPVVWWGKSTTVIDALKEHEDALYAALGTASAHRINGMDTRLLAFSIVTVVVGIFVLAFAILTIISILKSLNRLIIAFDEIVEHRNFSIRVPVGNRDEFGQINQLLNQLLDFSDLLIRDKEQLATKAESANQAKSNFLATMSHEIRTPMNGVLGMAQLLLMPGIQEEERLECAKVIMNSGQTLLTILNDILDLSKVEAGRMELEDLAFDPSQLVREVSMLFNEQARAKGLAIQAAWKGADGQLYRGDAVRLRQMLSNLLTNAIKFTSEGFVRIEASEIDGQENTAVLQFSIIDTGIGIPPEKQKLLFQPFSQVDASTTRKYGGSGLGLSIVRSLAELMGGEAGVSSTEGEGAHFWFRIQAERTTAAEKLPGTEKATAPLTIEQPTTPAEAGYVLVVDDNPTNQKVIKALLAKQGLRAETASDGAEAVELITAGATPALVLMDCQMPVMDGIEATIQIRQWEREGNRPSLPIIALTAGAFEADRERCLSVGMNDFMTKPIQVTTLLALLKKWMNFDSPLRG